MTSRQRSGRFVAVDGAKKTYPDGVGLILPFEDDSGKAVFPSRHFKRAKPIKLRSREAPKRLHQTLNGPLDLYIHPFAPPGSEID